jgi:Raf kinase inhibitor-like YbhB/YbcL family protein
MTFPIIALLVALAAASAAQKGVFRMETVTISSPAFTHGEAIPARYTCDGADVSPPLTIGTTPPEARSLALIMDDPDAPMGTWVHWVVWNIPAHTREIPEDGLPLGASQGRNDWRRSGYGGPCPPSGTHRYFFRLYALDTPLQLAPSTTKADLERAMQGHILARGELMGTYRIR